MSSGDYRAALAHFETAASLYRPDEHRDSASFYLTLLAEALALARKIEEALAVLDGALAKSGRLRREGLGRRN